MIPGNGIFVVRGEMTILMTAMKRGGNNRWNYTTVYQDDEPDSLLKPFNELQKVLNKIEDLRLLDPNVFLNPFLDVIRSDETTSPITSLSLSAINKFLTYGLIDATSPLLAATVENIADAVTHAKFVGTDTASDGVVLLKIIQVLLTLIMSPEGSVLTNESVCEIMLSCFRLAFEPRLNDLIRRSAEHALKDMVLLLFMRLPQFSEDRHQFSIKKIKMKALDSSTRKSKKSKQSSSESLSSRKLSNPKLQISKVNDINETNDVDDESLKSPALLKVQKTAPLATTPASPSGNIVDMQGSITQTPRSSTNEGADISDVCKSSEVVEDGNLVVADQEKNGDDERTLLSREDSVENDADIEDDGGDDCQSVKSEEYINSKGVRFTQQSNNSNPLLPYGLPCIRELFRFLISLCNPLDKQNTDAMIHMGLNLLTVALEVGGDCIGRYDTLLGLVKDEMCRNLFSLLNTERLTIFAANLQVCFLLFESLRTHLKFQLEYYLGLLTEIIGSDNQKMSFEVRQLALDNILQFWRLPGFASEIYVNYDCDLYCTNLFENLTKLLSKTALSTYGSQSFLNTQVMAMDSLLTVIESVERNCASIKSGTASSFKRHSRNNSSIDKITIENDNTTSGGDESTIENIKNYLNSSTQNDAGHRGTKNTGSIVTKEQLMDIKNKKQIITQGTELFNSRADKGIQFLMENNILSTPLDTVEVANFLRENPGLDKKMIGEYISKKKNVEIKILEAFVKSFDFSNTTIDAAIRAYLETFRIPGEAPLIFLVIEYFSDHWHRCNNEPFSNTDAAFKLAYSIIMLNMDQHNHNAKRLNIPMTAVDFQKNLRGLNGNGDFEPEVLLNIFNAIKNEEIIMPAEQTGIIRENYLWKMLLRRGVAKDGQFSHVYDSSYDKEIFQVIWGSALSALSHMFYSTTESTLVERSKVGFMKCAAISSHYNLHENFDAVVLTLCKFTTLLTLQPDVHEITVAVQFGQDVRAMDALKCVFSLIHEHGDCMRDGWKIILDVIITLFRLKLVPKGLMEVEDFCDPAGKVALIHEKIQLPKAESGIFSSLYSYLSNDSQRVPTYDENEIIKISKKCVKDCQIDQMIIESKFLQFESLNEMIKAFILQLKPPESNKSLGLVLYQEDQVVFLLEFMVKILIQNRDRVLNLWNDCRDQIYLLLMGAANCDYDYLMNRTTIAILKLAIYLMRNEELCPVVLQSLNILLMLKPNTIYRISKQISIGMYELLKTSAQNIHTEADWAIIFTILECVGAGALPPEVYTEDSPVVTVGATKSDGALSSEDDSGLPDRGYISDSELLSKASTPVLSPSGENWILVNNENDNKISMKDASPQHPQITSLSYPCKLLTHSPFALVKCWDCLAFIVRNVAHITPYNFESCVKCIRTFVEATLNGGKKLRRTSNLHLNIVNNKIRNKNQNAGNNQSAVNANGQKLDYSSGADSDCDDLPERYQTIAIQLLDLMHTLHTRTAQIFRWWAEEGGAIPQCSALWEQGWRPILQGISRLSTDHRRQVRTSAITCLQRSLLVHDLQTLSGPEWSSCFKQVLFPLLTELLNEPPSNADPSLLEESKMRAATIMSKVFLHHLTPLISLPNFNELWLEILDYLERFMKIGSDMLYEAVLESLKNMLLVMHSVRVFHNNDGQTHSMVWEITWKRIGEFLPHLREELFKSDGSELHNMNRPPQMTPVPERQLSQHQQQGGLSFGIASNPHSSNSISTITGPQNMYPSAPPPQLHPPSPTNDAPNKSSIILQPPGNLLSQPHGSPLLVSSPQPSPINIPMLMTQNLLNQTNSNPNINIVPQITQNPNYIPQQQAWSSSQYIIQPQQLQINENVMPTIVPQPESNYIQQVEPQQEQFNQSSPLSITTHHTNENYNNETHTYNESLTPIPMFDLQNPPIPFSHLITSNQYPSLNPNNRVPINIAQSFSPVFIQPQTNVPVEGGDIYNDYLNNPYNLTLHDNQSHQPSPIQMTSGENIANDTITLSPAKLGASNVFQSTNYFGASSTDTSGMIQPGSELLYGGNQ